MTDLTENSVTVAQTARYLVDILKLSAGRDTVSSLMTTVARLEGQIHYLQNFAKESGDLMLEIVKGTIPIAG